MIQMLFLSIFLAVAVIIFIVYVDFLDDIAVKDIAQIPIKEVRIREIIDNQKRTVYVAEFKHLIFWVSCKVKIPSINDIDTYLTRHFSSKQLAEDHLQKFTQK